MRRILYAEIPTYLHDSDFFTSLSSEEPDGPFDIPEQYFVDSDVVSNIHEFARLLDVTDYWGSKRIPLGLLLFCYTRCASVWLRLAMRYSPRSQMVKDLVYGFAISPALDATRAVSTDRNEITQFLFDQQIFNDKAVATAARHGRLDWLKAILARGFVMDEEACAEAAEGGHLDCLIHLHVSGCKWDYNVLVNAARGGHMDCLKYAQEKGCPWDKEVTLAAVRCEQKDALQYALEHGCELHEDVCIAAGTCLGVLEVLFAHGAKFHTSTAAYAGQNNLLHCLQYLYGIGCPWDEGTTSVAAGCGHMESLRYALENGCNYSTDVLICAAKAGNLPCLQYLIVDQSLFMPEDGSLFEAAFAYTHYPCVKYLIDIGCPFHVYSFNASEVCIDWEDGNILECLKYAVQFGMEQNTALTSYIIGQALTLPETVRYLCDEGWIDDSDMVELISQHFKYHTDCSSGSENVIGENEPVGNFDDDMLLRAVEANDLQLVVTLFEQGVMWEPYATESAVVYGYLDILQYALSSGLPYTPELLILAASVNKLTCLKYLVEEWAGDEDLSLAFGAALMGAHIECLQYLCHRNCQHAGYTFVSVRRGDIVDSEMWDCRFSVCIKTAVQHGWRPNEALVVYVQTEQLPLCLQFLSEREFVSCHNEVPIL